VGWAGGCDRAYAGSIQRCYAGTIGTQPSLLTMLLVSAFFANLNFRRHLRFSPEALLKKSWASASELSNGIDGGAFIAARRRVSGRSRLDGSRSFGSVTFFAGLAAGCPILLADVREEDRPCHPRIRRPATTSPASGRA